MILLQSIHADSFHYFLMTIHLDIQLLLLNQLIIILKTFNCNVIVIRKKSYVLNICQMDLILVDGMFTFINCFSKKDTTD